MKQSGDDGWKPSIWAILGPFRKSYLFQFQMEICTLELKNEPGRAKIMTDNQGKPIAAR